MLDFLPENGIKVMVLALVSWAAAQILKGIIDRIIYGEFSLQRFLASGGMPSSHSSLVTCCAVTIGRIYGFSSGLFALATVFAGVVMYDACHVRKASGEQAQALNDLIRTLSQAHPDWDPQEELKVVMGHTLLQVFFGALLGAAVALVIG
jgi:acid phosphatase family membrane protein YuiD